MSYLLEQIRTYHDLSKKGELTASEELKLTIAAQTMQQNEILTVADEIRLRDRSENMGNRIAALKEKLENCKMKYDVYVDFPSTLREISAEDYLKKLEEEESSAGKERQKSTRRSYKCEKEAAETVPYLLFSIIQKVCYKRPVFIAYMREDDTLYFERV